MIVNCIGGGNIILKRSILAFGILLLFFVSSVTPIILGCTNDVSERNISTENYNSYHISEIYEHKRTNPVEYNTEQSNHGSFVIETRLEEPSSPIASADGPMDSPWPMYCHDARHTGRSPYSTAGNTGFEKWRVWTNGWIMGGPVIDNDGTIYVGSHDFYAIYPNGTLKWKYDTPHVIESAAAIDENGVIYIGTMYAMPNYLYAIYTSNGTLKWKYQTGNHIHSSPAIAEDGTIYFGHDGSGYPHYTGWIIALYPNGTLKWRYETNDYIYSSPAIGDDGTVYCGSHDTYLYALYPNNGTLKWKYKTGHWIRVSPCIADDGSIYVVSLDYYLHAVNPNGTLKWKTNVGAGTSPTIGQDGTIYCGYRALHAIDPIDGSVKWTFDIGDTMRGGTPCNSIDGTIYIGTSDNGWIIAVNPDGKEKWRRRVGGCESAPAIGEDGTVYVGSIGDDCFLHAFGRGELEADANGPYYGLINEPVQFTGSASGGYSPHSYHWDFGDTHSSDEQNPTHSYTNPGNYTVTLTITDDEQNIATDTTYTWIQTSNEAPNKPTINGANSGKPGISYDYIFSATDPDGTPIYLYIDWDDGEIEEWIGPYTSDEQIIRSHTWTEQGTYTIRAKAKDIFDAEGDWGTLTVSMPKSKVLTSSLFLRFLERFPILKKLLNLIN